MSVTDKGINNAIDSGINDPIDQALLNVVPLVDEGNGVESFVRENGDTHFTDQVK